MGLFGKKEKKACAICEGKIGLLSVGETKDGFSLCDDCEKAISRWCPQSAYDVTLEQAQKILRLEDMNNDQRKVELGIYGDAASCFKIFDCTKLKYYEEDIYLSDNALFDEAWVLIGVALFGDFSKGDRFYVDCNGAKLGGVIADCTKATEATFTGQVNIGSFDGYIVSGERAWLLVKLDHYDAGESIVQNQYAIIEGE